ncbi:MAG: dihydrofolate reductase [Clostridia bacterium]|nr:dihydrofolate reductase [Clostridia bacterium]
MFNKLVAIEPVSLIPSAEEKLHDYAKEVVLYPDIPADDEEILRRIDDADAVLLSYTSRITRSVIERCRNVRYIGMCCSLYSEESANVDIACAREHGIRVLGIRDYGDRGVVEYVLHELIGLLHGFGGKKMLRDEPVEITGLKVGVVGLGVSGRMIAEALQFMGAEISYYSRSRKTDAELAGMAYKPLHVLLAKSDVVFTCLNKNVLLLQQPEFEALGNGKVLFNTSIGPGFDSNALNAWVRQEGNHFFCDTKAAAGVVPADFFSLDNVYCPAVSAGRTKQAFVLLSQKVLANIETALEEMKNA